MIRVGAKRGDENEVLDTRIPRRFDKVSIAFQVHAPWIVLASAPGGICRGDHGLDAFDGGIQRGAIAQVSMNRLRACLDQRLSRRGATVLGQLRGRRVVAHQDAHFLTLLQQSPRNHAANDPRSTDYQDHSYPPTHRTVGCVSGHLVQLH